MPRYILNTASILLLRHLQVPGTGDTYYLVPRPMHGPLLAWDVMQVARVLDAWVAPHATSRSGPRWYILRYLLTQVPTQHGCIVVSPKVEQFLYMRRSYVQGPQQSPLMLMLMAITLSAYENSLLISGTGSSFPAQQLHKYCTYIPIEPHSPPQVIRLLCAEKMRLISHQNYWMHFTLIVSRHLPIKCSTQGHSLLIQELIGQDGKKQRLL